MLLIVSGRIMQFLLMLLTLKISTYLLVPAEMGKMALVTTTLAFVSLFLINPVGMYVNRQMHVWNQQGLVKHNLLYHWFYILGVSLFASIVLGIVNYFGLMQLPISSSFLVSFALGTLFFNTINQTSIPSLNLLGYRFSFTVLSIATVVASLVFAVVLVINFGHRAEFWLLGILGGQVLLALIGSWIFYGKLNQPKSKQLLSTSLKDAKRVLFFSWPIALAVGLTWFQSQSYRFFIDYSFGLNMLGLFVAGYGISAGIMAAFESVFTTYFQPEFYKKVAASDLTNQAIAWNEYAVAIIPSLILMLFVIAALAPQLTRIMLAQNYQNAAQYVVWGAAIEMFRVLTNVFSLAAHANKNTKLLISPNLLGAVISLFLMYCLMPIWGITGICLALLAAGFSVTTFLYFKVKSHLPLSIPYAQIIQATVFGMSIYLLDYSLNVFVSLEPSIILTLAHIGLIGIIVLFIEFILLKRLAIFGAN